MNLFNLKQDESFQSKDVIIQTQPLKISDNNHGFDKLCKFINGLPDLWGHNSIYWSSQPAQMKHF